MKRKVQTTDKALSGHLVRDYGGKWTTDFRNGNLQLYEGGKLLFDVPCTREAYEVFKWLVVALEDREILISRLEERIHSVGKARAARSDVVRQIVLEAAARLAEQPAGSESAFAGRVKLAADREIKRRRAADREGSKQGTPKQDSVSDRYVRQVLKDAARADK